jgi:hypothetical protein
MASSACLVVAELLYLPKVLILLKEMDAASPTCSATAAAAARCTAQNSASMLHI